jgi:hypothetical protein
VGLQVHMGLNLTGKTHVETSATLDTRTVKSARVDETPNKESARDRKRRLEGSHRLAAQPLVSPLYEL